MLGRSGLERDPGGSGPPDPKPLNPVYAAIGLATVAAGAAVSVTRRVARAAAPLGRAAAPLGRAAAPLGRAVLHPPVLAQRLHPARVVDTLTDRGRGVMASRSGDLERAIAAVVPAVVREILDTLDLNVVILERVDLDGLVANVDLAEIIDRIDVDAVVRQVDVDAIVQRLDLEPIVRRVDIDAIAQRIDLDAIADRIDLERIVARIDVDAIVARVDLNAIVDRLNVVSLAEEVINEIDLPEIIRDSTGSMASQVVRDARMQGVDADEAVSRLMDRLLRRRRKGSPGVPRQSPAAEADSIPDAEWQP